MSMKKCGSDLSTGLLDQERDGEHERISDRQEDLQRGLVVERQGGSGLEDGKCCGADD